MLRKMPRRKTTTGLALWWRERIPGAKGGVRSRTLVPGELIRSFKKTIKILFEVTKSLLLLSYRWTSPPRSSPSLSGAAAPWTWTSTTVADWKTSREELLPPRRPAAVRPLQLPLPSGPPPPPFPAFWAAAAGAESWRARTGLSPSAGARRGRLRRRAMVRLQEVGGGASVRETSQPSREIVVFFLDKAISILLYYIPVKTAIGYCTYTAWVNRASYMSYRSAYR